MKHLIWITVLIFVSCSAPQEVSSEAEPTYILIDGKHVEMVSDEFGNQYLKQYTYGSHYIYVPFPFETEELGDSLRIYEIKTPLQ